jgi:hypothetical protein
MFLAGARFVCRREIICSSSKPCCIGACSRQGIVRTFIEDRRDLVRKSIILTRSYEKDRADLTENRFSAATVRFRTKFWTEKPGGGETFYRLIGGDLITVIRVQQDGGAHGKVAIPHPERRSDETKLWD